MRDYSGRVEAPNRVVLPVTEKFPDSPIIGEIVYLNIYPHQGIYLFSGQGWVPMYMTDNNIWETVIAEKEQRVFNLQNQYQTDGKSLVVYKNGVRLQKNCYAEIGPNAFAYKELNADGDVIDLEGGEIFEVQIFNVKRHGIFDVKALNRRNGLC